MEFLEERPLFHRISECYKTSLTGPGIPQSKLASKSLVNKFVHSERDASISGAMRDENTRYLFFHWVIGHTAPTCEVLSIRKGAEMGFPKRFHCVFRGSKPATNPQQECSQSKQLMIEFIAFMATHANKGDVEGGGIVVTCDQYAAGWLRQGKDFFWGKVLVMIFHSSGAMSFARQILLCSEDFQEQHPTLSSAWSQKLDYADSDLLRLANVVRRLRQFLVFVQGNLLKKCQSPSETFSTLCTVGADR